MQVIFLVQISLTHYLDYDVIFTEEKTAARTYMTTICRSCWFEGVKLSRLTDLRISTSNSVDDLLKRLHSYDSPRDPPAVPVFEEVIPSAALTMMIDNKAMKEGLDVHFKRLREFSKYWCISSRATIGGLFTWFFSLGRLPCKSLK